MTEIYVTPKTGPSVNRHRSKQDYQTPFDFRDAVTARFGPIECDLAADQFNCFGASFITKEQDSFRSEWHKKLGPLWLNPPFADIRPWTKKCAEETAKGACILFLTPASVDSNWWTDFVHDKAGVLFLNPRLSFDGRNSYPKPLALSCYNLRPSGTYAPWRWK